jgi:hypothetical protein
VPLLHRIERGQLRQIVSGPEIDHAVLHTERLGGFATASAARGAGFQRLSAMATIQAHRKHHAISCRIYQHSLNKLNRALRLERDQVS